MGYALNYLCFDVLSWFYDFVTGRASSNTQASRHKCRNGNKQAMQIGTVSRKRASPYENWEGQLLQQGQRAFSHQGHRLTQSSGHPWLFTEVCVRILTFALQRTWVCKPSRSRHISRLCSYSPISLSCSRCLNIIKNLYSKSVFFLSIILAYYI